MLGRQPVADRDHNGGNEIGQIAAQAVMTVEVAEHEPRRRGRRRGSARNRRTRAGRPGPRRGHPPRPPGGPATSNTGSGSGLGQSGCGSSRGPGRRSLCAPAETPRRGFRRGRRSEDRGSRRLQGGRIPRATGPRSGTQWGAAAAVSEPHGRTVLSAAPDTHRRHAHRRHQPAVECHPAQRATDRYRGHRLPGWADGRSNATEAGQRFLRSNATPCARTFSNSATNCGDGRSNSGSAGPTGRHR